MKHSKNKRSFISTVFFAALFLAFSLGSVSAQAAIIREEPGRAQISGEGTSSRRRAVGKPSISFFLDRDGDGYGDPSSPVASGIGQPVPVATNGTDCDDTRSAYYQNVNGHLDVDQDGYVGAPRAFTACVGGSRIVNGRTYYYYSIIYPAGFLGSSQVLGYEDCSDTNELVYRFVAGGEDHDHDGYIANRAVSLNCVGASRDISARTYYYYGDHYQWLKSSHVLGYNDANDDNPDRH